MSERPRLFFALALPEPGRRALVGLQAALARELGTGARLVEPANLHVTLAFLGSVAPELVPALAALARELAGQAAPIEAEWRQVTGFPSPARARLVVAELDDRQGALRTLASRVARGVEAFGVSPEAREYRPHVTLARLRGPANLEAMTDRPRLDGALALEELALFRSELRPAGSVYTALVSARLGEPSREVPRRTDPTSA